MGYLLLMNCAYFWDHYFSGTPLSDFGLAKMVETPSELTGSGVGIGTPSYVSPEQAKGQNVDHRTDIA